MKFLWRANVAGIAKPIYLIAQNMPSAGAAIYAHSQIHPEDILNMQRLDPWNDALNMTVVHWPEPPPEPEPQPYPPP